jgi:hypothetical protein
MRVANGNRFTLAPRNANEAVKLRRYGSAVALVVQEDIAISGWHTELAGHAFRDRPGCGSAIDEEEITLSPEALHEPTHVTRMARHQAPLVVINAHRMRHRRQIIPNRLPNLVAGAVQTNAGMASTGPTHRLHGLVE